MGNNYLVDRSAGVELRFDLFRGSKISDLCTFLPKMRKKRIETAAFREAEFFNYSFHFLCLK